MTCRSTPPDHGPGKRLVISSDSAASSRPFTGIHVARGPSSRASTRVRPWLASWPVPGDRELTSHRTGTPDSRTAAASSSRLESSSSHCSSSMAITRPATARLRSSPTSARSRITSVTGACGNAWPRAARSALACGPGIAGSAVSMTGSSRSATLASAGGAPEMPVVRKTTAAPGSPAEAAPAAARHRLVLPMPGGPVMMTAVASPWSPKRASLQALSSASRPSSPMANSNR